MGSRFPITDPEQKGGDPLIALAYVSNMLQSPLVTGRTQKDVQPHRMLCIVTLRIGLKHNPAILEFFRAIGAQSFSSSNDLAFLCALVWVTLSSPWGTVAAKWPRSCRDLSPLFHTPQARWGSSGSSPRITVLAKGPVDQRVEPTQKVPEKHLVLIAFTRRRFCSGASSLVLLVIVFGVWLSRGEGQGRTLSRSVSKCSFLKEAEGCNFSLRCKDVCVMSSSGGNRDPVPRLHCCCWTVRLCPRSATVWMDPLEPREGHGGWMRPISWKPEMWDTEKAFVPTSTTQVPPSPL